MEEKISRVLFVDDEINILKSLKRLMADEGWDCHFMETSAQALEFCATTPVDLVVSDVMMPEMNGIQLAEQIRRRYPATIRIFLTGYSKQENVIQALTEGHTQQIIPKPWIDQELKEIIRSALRQSAQQKKYSPEFQTLINSIPLLPALPESYANVRSCIVDNEVDIEKMAHYISQDVSISSALLHWANSALFGQRFQVDTIKKAIIVLGTDIVESLILSDAVDRTISAEIPRVKGFDFLQFKKHSMATAILSRLLIKSVYAADHVKHDRAFIAGLLHDLGKLVVASFLPEKFERAIQRAKKRYCSLSAAERGLYNTQHAEIGAFLAEWWALPPFIVNAIAWHHQPRETPIEEEVISAAHVANLLSYQFNYGCSSDTAERDIEPRFKDMFFLNEEAIEILKTETEKTIAELMS